MYLIIPSLLLVRILLYYHPYMYFHHQFYSIVFYACVSKDSDAKEMKYATVLKPCSTKLAKPDSHKMTLRKSRGSIS